jgi:hypothetical protein
MTGQRWIIGIAILIILLFWLFPEFHFGDRVTRIDIGPVELHFEHYNRESSAEHYAPPSRVFVIAGSQPTTFALLLDVIFRNQNFILKLIAALVSAGFLFFIFALSPLGSFTDMSAGRWRDRGEMPKKPLRRLALGLVFVVIVILIAIGVYAFWADKKAEGSAVLLAPPGPACLPKRDSAKTAIVLIHGWNGDDTSWGKFPELLCKDETFLDTELFVVNYPIYMSRRQLKIDTLARWLRQTFFSDALRSYEDIHIIVHVGSEEAPIEGLASVRRSVGSRPGAPV